MVKLDDVQHKECAARIQTVRSRISRGQGFELMSAVELERLLKSATGDPAERPRFISQLLQSDVYVLGWTRGRKVLGRKLLKAGENVELLKLKGKDGLFVPFFSSEAAMSMTFGAWGDIDRRFMKMKCRSLFELTGPGRRIVYGPSGVTVHNSFRSYHLKWADISHFGFGIRPTVPVAAFAYMKDGSDVLLAAAGGIPLYAGKKSRAGMRSQELIDELNACLQESASD